MRMLRSLTLCPGHAKQHQRHHRGEGGHRQEEGGDVVVDTVIIYCVVVGWHVHEEGGDVDVVAVDVVVDAVVLMGTFMIKRESYCY